MQLDEFRLIDKQTRINKPRLFSRFPSDRLASLTMLEEVEKATGVTICANYRCFLQEFGGGRYGYTVVFSADSKSDWYLPHRFSKISQYLPPDLLPFSDDFAGGVYAFQIIDNNCVDTILYWNTDGGVVRTKYKNIFDYVAAEAYGDD